MKADTLKKRIDSLATHILFDYNNKPCGIDPITRSQIDIWYGDAVITANSVDEAMQTPLFDGLSLEDICTKLQNVE